MSDMPSLDQMMFPLLKCMADGEEHAMSELRQLVADDLGLSQDLRDAVFEKSGRSVLANRLGWAQSDLLHAGLTETPRVNSGIYRITDLGRSFLAEHSDGFERTDVEVLPGFVQWTSGWGKGGRSLTEEKLAEFGALYADFLAEYPTSEAGLEHNRHYTTSRQSARVNFDKAGTLQRSSPEFVDAVMWGLIPYRGTATQLKHGAWVHWAPSTIGGTYRAFYATRWTSDEDWAKVAGALFDFVQGCIDAPDQLGPLAEQFVRSPYAKGFQQGLVTPILNALRPDDFYLTNSKVLATVNYFAGARHTQSLAGYSALNETAHKLVDELAPALETGPESVDLPQDRFDMFCHWLVAVRHFFDEQSTISDPSPVDDEEARELVEPYATIFADYDEAEWAFGLLAQMADRLGLTGPDDPRYACTLRYRDRAIHFNFCRWFLAGFYAPGFREERLALTIRRDRTAFGGLSGGFTCRPEEPGAAFVYPTMPEAQAMSAEQQAALDDTLDYAADRFESHSATAYRRAHVADLGKAIFDPEFRQQLLAGKVVDIARADYPLEQMAAETGFPLPELRAWVSALQRKKQAILYGPPGTGKTYVARRLAQHLVATAEADDGFLELVQFHPAYAYEDFLQGIRPQTDDDGTLTYDLERGRFLEFIDKARERDGTCVLIIDEINRANIARVFGELMYLLEYRDDEIALAGGGTLKIPENVRLIGTMNTADRSIALVDHALRRRFAFLELRPQYHVLAKFHADKATGFPVDDLLVVLEKLNGQIRDPHYFVGISFFLDEHLGETIESVWRTEIYPYLDEYFFDQPKVVEQFTWQAVSPQLGL
jgi:5-methylcytosine-specific restriction protein B